MSTRPSSNEETTNAGSREVKGDPVVLFDHILSRLRAAETMQLALPFDAEPTDVGDDGLVEDLDRVDTGFRDDRLSTPQGRPAPEGPVPDLSRRTVLLSTALLAGAFSDRPDALIDLRAGSAAIAIVHPPRVPPEVIENVLRYGLMPPDIAFGPHRPAIRRSDTDMRRPQVRVVRSDNRSIRGKLIQDVDDARTNGDGIVIIAPPGKSFADAPPDLFDHTIELVLAPALVVPIVERFCGALSADEAKVLASIADSITVDDLFNTMARHRSAGDTVRLGVVRGGEARDLNLTLESGR